MIVAQSPLLPLQGAMYARLTADAALTALGVKVFDRVNEDHFPRIVIGEDREMPDDTACYSVSDVYSTVRVYTQTPGSVASKNISERVRFLLTQASGFTVPGFEMSVGHCERVIVRQHDDGLRTQAIIEFEYRLSAAD